MNIRTQLTLLASGLVVLTVLLTGGLQFVSEGRAERAEQQERLAGLSESLAARARAAAGDLDALEDPALELVESSEAAYVWVLDPLGKVLLERPFDSATHGSLERSMNAVLDALKAGGRVENRREWSSVAVVEHVYPLSVGGRPAALVVGFDRAASEARMAERLRARLGRAARLAVIPLLCGVLAASWMARRLTRTLDKLAAGAARIGQGHLSARVLTTRADELGELSEEFNAMGRKLEELEELKDQFLAKITHDLRSPLSAVVGYAGLLEMGNDGPVTPKQLRSLKLIVESANYLAELIDNILDLTKMEAGRMTYEPVPVDLAASAAAVAEQLGVKAAEYGVRLDVSGVPRRTTVVADEQALRRVLVNLLSNSLKFTPSGGVVAVEWSRTPEGADRVGVRDTGIGIPADKTGMLFTKFTQVAETANKVRPARGTGLGLAICKEIVEAHGGRIWAESEYGKGSVFFFTLPPAAAEG
ncbi:MAG: HAMP domain-containing histidine kinase [Elusimicrobia bacterium]|nr:HAMP domain-containing histidine kinase [Elusimicrobiota bacterium]